jgi:hypothetical protein
MDVYSLAKALQLNQPALGASGSAMSYAVVFACLFPETTFLIYFIVPVPARVAVSILLYITSTTAS